MDERYKRLFAFHRMVEDLLRAFVSGDELDASDLSTLRRLSSEYVSDDMVRRHGDMVWRLRLGDGWAFLLLLLEFQSRDDRYMALRILSYTSLLYEELVRNGAPEVRQALPAVVPVVLYNGPAPWSSALEVGELITPVGESLAPYQPGQRYIVVDEQHVGADALPAGNLMRGVIGLEQSRSPDDMARVAGALSEWLAGSEHAELRGVFLDWIRSTIERATPVGEAPPVITSLEEARMALEERVKEWPTHWIQQGIEQGREQGLEHERYLLCRMAALQFGAETGERLAALLADIGEAEQLTDVGASLVQCRAGDEFLARVETISGS